MEELLNKNKEIILYTYLKNCKIKNVFSLLFKYGVIKEIIMNQSKEVLRYNYNDNFENLIEYNFKLIDCEIKWMTSEKELYDMLYNNKCIVNYVNRMYKFVKDELFYSLRMKFEDLTIIAFTKTSDDLVHINYHNDNLTMNVKLSFYELISLVEFKCKKSFTRLAIIEACDKALDIVYKHNLEKLKNIEIVL